MGLRVHMLLGGNVPALVRTAGIAKLRWPKAPPYCTNDVLSTKSSGNRWKHSSVSHEATPEEGGPSAWLLLAPAAAAAAAAASECDTMSAGRRQRRYE